MNEIYKTTKGQKTVSPDEHGYESLVEDRGN